MESYIGLLTIIGAIVLLIFIIRSITLWYFRINDIIKVLENIHKEIVAKGR